MWLQAWMKCSSWSGDENLRSIEQVLVENPPKSSVRTSTRERQRGTDERRDLLLRLTFQLDRHASRGRRDLKFCLSRPAGRGKEVSPDDDRLDACGNVSDDGLDAAQLEAETLALGGKPVNPLPIGQRHLLIVEKSSQDQRLASRTRTIKLIDKLAPKMEFQQRRHMATLSQSLQIKQLSGGQAALPSVADTGANCAPQAAFDTGRQDNGFPISLPPKRGGKKPPQAPIRADDASQIPEPDIAFDDIAIDDDDGVAPDREMGSEEDATADDEGDDEVEVEDDDFMDEGDSDDV